MNDERPDAALVVAFLEGDHRALAAIYDRYADALFDTAAAMLGDRHEAADVTQDVFLAGAERLGQLRDGSRLKAWLFAILRNEVYRRSARRRRARPTDFTAGEAAEMAAPRGAAADAAAIELSELAAEVRAAAGGLEQRDQLVLELVSRQQLRGDDLAAALGVSVQQSYVLVNRMRERVERSLGALAVARSGRRDCAELATLLSGWDGQFDVQVRKRVARHIDRCAVCATTQRRVGVLALVAAAPALAAPAALRDAVLITASHRAAQIVDTGGTWPADGDGFPRPQLAARRARLVRQVAVATAATIVAGAVAGAVLSNRGDDLSSAPEPRPTAAAISAPATETADSALGDTSQPASTVAAVVDPPTTASTSATTTPVPAIVTTTSDPQPLVSGPRVLVAATTSTTGALDADAPVVELVSAPSSVSCPWSVAPLVTANVIDASTVDVVTLSWNGPGGPGEAPMSRSSGSSWSARLGVAQVGGTWTFVVSAIDPAGNRGTAPGTVVVNGC